jgi:predicted DNA-binding transcriptional regulator YafY
MRADRLISLLLLLQTRGRMTAQALAAELEVSERTIYRDIDALSTSGVPVYGERGPEGGYALLDGYRTSLTGLTADEMRAFFMLSMPAPLADLGIGPDIKTALLKLSAALPTDRRQEEERVRQRFYLDATWWGQGNEPSPYVQTIQRAVWQDRRLVVSYERPPAIHIEQVVEPYGLVAKAGVWYLVYAVSGQMRALRVSQLQSARILDETFTRSKDLDLVAFWQQWCARVEDDRLSFHVTARVAPGMVSHLPLYLGEGLGDALARAGPPGADGWLTLELAFESFYAARMRLLACGRDAEVLSPASLRQSILDFARQVEGVYTRRE